MSPTLRVGSVASYRMPNRCIAKETLECQMKNTSAYKNIFHPNAPRRPCVRLPQPRQFSLLEGILGAIGNISFLSAVDLTMARPIIGLPLKSTIRHRSLSKLDTVMVLLVLLTDYTSDVPTSNGSCLAISHNMACFARSGSCGPCRPRRSRLSPLRTGRYWVCPRLLPCAA